MVWQLLVQVEPAAVPAGKTVPSQTSVPVMNPSLHASGRGPQFKHVAELPERSAIVYTAVFSDGEGTFYPPATALGIIAEKANRPIVVVYLGDSRTMIRLTQRPSGPMNG